MPPWPFCTVTSNLPVTNFTDPLIWIAVLPVKVATQAGVQPGPLNVTNTVLGSKLVPVMVKLKDWSPIGAAGDVANFVITGFGTGVPATKTVKDFEPAGVPLGPF